MDVKFSTTLSVDPGSQNLSHPSFFQNPEKDLELIHNIDVAKSTDPQDLWQKNVSFFCASNPSNVDRSQFSMPYDPNDPPLTIQERCALLEKLDPIMRVTLTNVTPTLLFYLFFSKQNVANIQQNIRFTVNKYSGYHIGNQSLVELTIAMESIYSQHARQIDEHTAPSRVLMYHIKQEVARLNELLINEIVPTIVNGVEQHTAYLKQAATPRSALSLSRPIDTRITGTKIYRSSTDIF